MAQIGIYEKALPKDISWKERFSLVKEMDFDFIEMSIDETDERLARLDWSEEKIAELREEMFSSGVRIHSICLSAHRRFPFGSADPEKKGSILFDVGELHQHLFCIKKYRKDTLKSFRINLATNS